MRKTNPLTAEQVVLAHEYCLTPGDIRREANRIRNLYIPKSLAPVCEHPEHGFCSHSAPTQAELEAINAKLGESSRVVRKIFAPTGHGYAESPNFTAAMHNNKLRQSVGLPKKRVKRVKTPGVSRALRYFCLNCKEWHLNTQTDHLKFKRGKGRPKK